MITFFVPGLPAPGGSKKAFVVGKRAVVVEDSKRNKPWRAAVAGFALDAMGDRAPLDGELSVSFRFIMPRPKGHYRTGKHSGVLRPNAPRWHRSKPDTTKLVRSTEDALKNICWRDDSQIAEQFASKVYGDRPGVQVTIVVLTGLDLPDLRSRHALSLSETCP